MPQHHCDHECDGHNSLNNGENLGVLYSLFAKIDLDKVECLNENAEGSGKYVLKLDNLDVAIFTDCLSIISGKSLNRGRNDSIWKR